MNIAQADAYELALDQLQDGRYVVLFPVKAYDGDEWWSCVATYSLGYGELTATFLHNEDPMIRARFLILATAQARKHTLRQAQDDGQLLQL